ncbi:MAG: ATP-dependent DNA helicase RecG, partial [Pseudomonadales bacterium]
MGTADPQQPVDSLKGVGPSLTEKLSRLGVRRLLDLLLHLPLRYQDRSRVVPLRELRAEQECLVQGQIVEARIAYGRRRSLVVTLEDETGYLNWRLFYFSSSQQKALKPGMFVQCFGQARFGREGLEMIHPEYRLFSTPPPLPDAELTPVYPATKGLGQGRLRSLCGQLLALDWPIDDGTPYEDLKFLHHPPAGTSADELKATQARVARDELTAYYLVMRHRQAQRQGIETRPLPPVRQLGRELLKLLGFALTGAQRRVTTEVLEDLSTAKPMLRLLQGDVGSGKTVVAAFAAIRVAEHGMQTALMAPTEILAEQHYLNFTAWLEPLGIRIVLITGSQSAKERKATIEAIDSGEALVAVGTHALFQNQVTFKRLALTVVDEQHRFGVHQRMALKDKGSLPHQLVMTATPIPRTLTMALYADMDTSTLDELPAGRQPIETRVVADEHRDEVMARIATECRAGRQAYWVCPLIEESDQLNAASVEATLPALKKALPGTRIATLHGRMSSQEKAQTMARFKLGEVEVLLATTVVEVGVDIPNATLMVIENPERLGLSQLHQLRGRVGRGQHKSRCILLYQTPLSEASRQRLQVIRESQDGFYIAEQDLKIRGPGDLLGTRQTGEQQFRIADLREHAHLIDEVVQRGDTLLLNDPATAARLLDVW